MQPVNEFPPEVAAELGYYVYRLIDPRNGQTFYVGKGCGNRVFQHVKCAVKYYDGAENSSEDDPNKFKVIQSIRQEGMEVIHVIQRWGLTEQEALHVEAALIDKPVLFYAPDIEAYRKSPGLNIDPEKEFGGCCWRDEGGIIEACAMDASGERKYDDSEFRRFFDGYAENLKGLYERSESDTPCIDALVDIVKGSLTNRVS